MVFTRRNLDWWCERGILFLILGMLMFAPLAFGAADSWAFLVVQGAAVVTFLLWATRLWLKAKDRPRLLWPPVAWAVLAFTLYALVRWLTADIEYIARREVIQVLVFAGLFFVVLNNLRGQEETEAVAWTLIATGAVVSMFACGQFLTHSDRVWNVFSDNPSRASGTYISPNHYAGFLELVIPLALAFLLAGKIKIVPRILIGYALVVMLAGLTATFSRGGWVANLTGILVVLGIFLAHKNHRLRAAILLAVLLGGGTLFVTQYLAKTHSYAQRVKAQDDSAGGRIDWSARVNMWRAATAMWQDHPWFGVGPAHYDYRFREYRPEMIQARPDRCHNDWLNLLTDWGVAGAAIVLAGMGIFIAGLLKTWPHARREENDFGSGQSNRFAFFVGAVGSLSALAVHSFMDFNLHIPANALIAVTLFALLASNIRFATEGHWVRIFQRERLLIMGTFIVIAAALVFAGWRGARETFWLARSDRAENFSEEQTTRLEKAFAAEPKNFMTAYEIGECYRTRGLEGGKDYRQITERAIGWYERAEALNPHHAYSLLRHGMCLDWLGDHTKAEKLLSDAELLDPNGYYLVAALGWHHVQTGDYAAARACYLRSLRLYGDNPTAQNYMGIVQDRLSALASGRPMLPRLP
jgi:O-antigen ligase